MSDGCGAVLDDGRTGREDVDVDDDGAMKDNGQLTCLIKVCGRDRSYPRRDPCREKILFWWLLDIR